MFALARLPGSAVLARAVDYCRRDRAARAALPWRWTASRQFAVVGTNIVPLTHSSSLVTNGAFALTRNPMYFGMVLALIGTALLLNRPWPWLVPSASRRCCICASFATKKR